MTWSDSHPGPERSSHPWQLRVPHHRRRPQIGYIFPLRKLQRYVNLKEYWEFAAENRGWNAWLTFSLPPASPESASPKGTK